ncbi:hypothetical protein [Nonomuraea ceibae]|uniref:hypothetical protein n=1 Tax=Nonomuraea ceibae TaxID=1935170 RepID=UPI001C5D487D|nr:hypothetical protein [Nonomuraea ceibae]
MTWGVQPSGAKRGDHGVVVVQQLVERAGGMTTAKARWSRGRFQGLGLAGDRGDMVSGIQDLLGDEPLGDEPLGPADGADDGDGGAW